MAAPYRQRLEIALPWAKRDVPPVGLGLRDQSDGRTAHLVIGAPFLWTGVFWAIVDLIAAVVVIGLVPLGRFVEALPVVLSACAISVTLLLPFVSKRNAEELEIADGMLWYQRLGRREGTALAALTEIAIDRQAQSIHVGRAGGPPLIVGLACSSRTLAWTQAWLSGRVDAALADLDGETGRARRLGTAARG